MLYGDIRFIPGRGLCLESCPAYLAPNSPRTSPWWAIVLRVVFGSTFASLGMPREISPVHILHLDTWSIQDRFYSRTRIYNPYFAAADFMILLNGHTMPNLVTCKTSRRSTVK